MFKKRSRAQNIAEQGESMAAHLPALLIEARRLAGLLQEGVHGRRRKGQGAAFWQFRRYQQEDGATLIDWRQSAKSDHFFVREKEWETTSLIWIWPDLSPSMQWRSGLHDPKKSERALLLAAALGFVLVESGEMVAFCGSSLPPARNAEAIARLVTEAAMRKDQNILFPMPGKGRGHILLLSDFLIAPEQIAKGVAAIIEAGLCGHCVHILDRAEKDWNFKGRILFSGLEGEPDFLAPAAESLRQAYQERLILLQQNIRQNSLMMGGSFFESLTHEPPLPALLGLARALGGQK